MSSSGISLATNIAIILWEFINCPQRMICLKKKLDHSGKDNLVLSGLILHVRNSFKILFYRLKISSWRLEKLYIGSGTLQVADPGSIPGTLWFFLNPLKVILELRIKSINRYDPKIKLSKQTNKNQPLVLR